MQTQPAANVRQRGTGHIDTEVRSADTDVDDIGEPHTIRRFHSPVVNGVHESQHRTQYGLHLARGRRQRMLAFQPTRSQQGVQDSTTFRVVDRIAREHRRAAMFDLSLPREGHEVSQCSRANSLAREVENDVRGARCKALVTLWIRSHQSPNIRAPKFGRLGSQMPPGRQVERVSCAKFGLRRHAS